MSKTPKGYPITGELTACKAKEGYALCSGDFEVAIVNLDAVSPDASREYALSIKRAVNSHAALVEALELARQCIAYCRRAHKDAQIGEGIPVEIFIDQALKLAKGA